MATINQPLARERELQRIQEQQIRQQQEAQQQQEQTVQVDRNSLKQNALNFLLSRGKANEAFKQLTRQEQVEVQDKANELEGSRAKITAKIVAKKVVANVESQAAQSLVPQVRKQIYDQAYKQAIEQSGNNSKYITVSVDRPTASSQFQTPVRQQFQTQAQSLVPKRTIFTPGPMQKPTSIKEIFTDPKQTRYFIKDVLTKDPVAEMNAKTFGNSRALDKGLIPNSSEFIQYSQSEQNRYLKYVPLSQTAFFSSIAGVSELPRIIKVPIRPTKIPEFIEVQQPIILKGIPRTVSSYLIKTETKAPQLVFDTTQAKGFFGKITREPPKLITTRTIRPVLDKTPVFTLTSRSGRRGQIDRLIGNSIPQNLEQLKSLPLNEQYLWRQLASNEVGRIVSLENVPKILNKNMQYTSGSIEKTKLLDVKRKSQSEFLFTTIPKGKTTSTFQTASRFKQIAETPEYDLLTGRIYYKDISKPFSRASGKTPVMKGTVVVMKETQIVDNIKDVKIQKPANIQKTPLSKTFQQTKTVTDLLVQTPKPIPRQVPRPRIVTKTVKTTTLPASALASSLYSVLAQRQVPIVSNIGIQRINQSLIQRQEQFQVQRQVQKQIQKQIERQIQVPSLISRQLQQQRQLQRQVQKQIQKQQPRTLFPLLVPRPKPRPRPIFTALRRRVKGKKRSNNLRQSIKSRSYQREPTAFGLISNRRDYKVPTYLLTGVEKFR